MGNGFALFLVLVALVMALYMAYIVVNLAIAAGVFWTVAGLWLGSQAVFQIAKQLGDF